MTMFLVSSDLRLAVVAFHLDLAGRDNARCAVKRFDLVLLEQEGDAVHVALDVLILVFEQSRELDARLADLDAHLRKAVARLLVKLGSVQQRLRGDAADIEAGAAEGGVFLDDRGFQSELRGAYRAEIAAGSGTDDDEIVGSHDKHLSIVIAGLVPAIPRDWQHIASPSGMAGPRPAMTE